MGKQSADFLEDVEETAPTSQPGPIKRLSKLEITLTEEMIAELRVEMHGNLMIAMQAITRFHEIDPESNSPPLEWMREFGIEQAQKLFRLAQLAYHPQRTAPVGIKLIGEMYKVTEGAQKNAQVNVLNAFNVFIGPQPPPPDEMVIDEPTD